MNSKIEDGAAVQETGAATQATGAETQETDTETQATDIATQETKRKLATKSKLLKAVPVAMEERHKALQEQGITTLNFTQYIIEALREKLARDEQQ